MNENPYQSPNLDEPFSEVDSKLDSRGNDEDYLKARLKKIRDSRQSWNRRCHFCAFAAILVGIGELNLVRFVLEVRSPAALGIGYYVVGTVLIIAGGTLHAFGPVSWFWFRGRV